MAHWTQKYLSIEYTVEHDCSYLCEMVLHNELGMKEVFLPKPESDGFFSKTAKIKEVKDSIATKIDSPIEKNPVLFICSDRLWHMGIMTYINNEWHVLHNDSNLKRVIIQRLRDMQEPHFKLEGFYQWN